MSLISEKYLPMEARTMAELEANASAARKNAAALDAYEADLARATEELRRKHGTDALEAERDRLASDAEAMGKDLRRIRCLLVAGTVDLLLRAMPGRHAGLSWELGAQVPGMKLSEADTGRLSYDDAYHMFTRQAMEDWPSIDVQPWAGGAAWISDGTVGTAVPASLLDGTAMAGFLSWADGRLAELSADWAEDWVDGMGLDREKREALMAALRKAGT